MITLMESIAKIFSFYINSQSKTTESVKEVNIWVIFWVSNPQASCGDVRVLTILPPRPV